jgi:exodeoxyribonuclease VII small subunit
MTTEPDRPTMTPEPDRPAMTTEPERHTTTPPQRTYEQAIARIEEIIRRLDSGEAGLRETLDLVKEGRDLVEYCAGELDAVSHGLEELRLDELVARLESERAPG